MANPCRVLQFCVMGISSAVAVGRSCRATPAMHHRLLQPGRRADSVSWPAADGRNNKSWTVRRGRIGNLGARNP
jgi:hypothetical protein